jgi:hypothetical protein
MRLLRRLVQLEKRKARGRVGSRHLRHKARQQGPAWLT